MAATSPPVRRAVTRLLPGPVAALLVLLLSGVGALGEHRDAAAPDERAAAVQMETTGQQDQTQQDQTQQDQTQQDQTQHHQPCGPAQACAVDDGADQHAGDAEPGADPRRVAPDRRHAGDAVPRNREAHPSLHAFASVPRPD